VDPGTPSSTGAEGAETEAFAVVREDHTLRLTGALRLSAAKRIWTELHRTLDGIPPAETPRALDLDLSGASFVDGAAVSILGAIRAELALRGVRAAVVGVPQRYQPLVDLYDVNRECAKTRRRKAKRTLEQIGAATEAIANEAKRHVAFLGDVASTLGALVRRPHGGHWKELPAFMERTGADAVPIVALLNFLLGFVTAYQAARQLKAYGANLYVADLVGISVSRELAPLMTAIIVCGRSGASFTAEIGTMKVAEEIDALRTLGLRPVAWLVVPRLIALVLVVPALTLLADIVGALGGLVVARTSLDISSAGYFVELRKAVHFWDVGSGLVKSAVFALTIAVVACQQGFSASGGAESVGRRTTKTVVWSLFSLVVLDAVMTVAVRSLGSR
jgi:phospholipid/cholesterol/gamma-HCH transport system permease protein